MDKLCRECNYLGKEKYDKSTFHWSLIVFFSNVLLLYYSIKYPAILVTIASVIFIIYSLYSLVSFLVDPNICPVCDNKKTMISIDSSEAKEIIKQNNLTVPAETSEQTKSPTT